MRFLLTNDDGIDSAFLHCLVQPFLDAGHDLFIAAPRTEQSWIGAAKSRTRPVKAVDRSSEFPCEAWAIDGTPSDCVNIALDHLVEEDKPVDAVISGINIGMNATLGFIIASGTIGGALEGALHGLPAFALSQDVTQQTFEEIKEQHGKVTPATRALLDQSAQQAARLVPALARETTRNRFLVHNLNFPVECSAASKLRRTVPAHVVVPRLFSPAADDGTHRMIFRYGEDLSPAGLQTDRAALAEGFISHSILDYTRIGLPVT